METAKRILIKNNVGKHITDFICNVTFITISNITCITD